MKKRILSFGLAVLIMLMPMTAYAADSAKASTLRLEKTEGSVSLSNKNGKTLTIKEGAKLYNGNTVTTSAKSYAYISLDATKAVKLDASSKAEVRQSGKKLEINLKSGNLFFNVTVPLEEDETLNIRTSTTITGVRGTAGVINVLSDTESMIYILDGNVSVTATDPKTGKAKEIAVGAGQAATVNDGSVVETKPITSDMISGFVAQEILKDPALQEKIAEQTDLPIEKIIDNADEKLKEDQQKSEEKQKDIDKQVDERKKADNPPSANQTANAAATTPSYDSNPNQSSNNDTKNSNNSNNNNDNYGNGNNNGGNNSGGNNSGNNSGGGNNGGGEPVVPSAPPPPPPPAADAVVVTEWDGFIATITGIIAQKDSTKTHFVQLSESVGSPTSITIPSGCHVGIDLNGKTLTLSEIIIESGASLTVKGNGSSGNLSGTIKVEAGSTLYVEGGSISSVDAYKAAGKTTYIAMSGGKITQLTLYGNAGTGVVAKTVGATIQNTTTNGTAW